MQAEGFFDKLFCKNCNLGGQAPHKGPNVSIVDASRSLYGGCGGYGQKSSITAAIETAKNAQKAGASGLAQLYSAQEAGASVDGLAQTDAFAASDPYGLGCLAQSGSA